MTRLLAAALLTALALAPTASASARQPAIVGGSVAPPGAWPWAAFVEVIAPDGTLDAPDGEPDVAFSCGGSLIGERWVLTVGHCVLLFGEVIGSPGFIAGLQYRIVLGQDNVATLDPANVYLAEADDVIALPPQAGWSVNGDLALIRLDRPAPQQAIRIPGASQDAAAFTQPGTPATVVGWGLTSEDAPEISFDLRQVDVPLVTDSVCVDAYPVIDFYGFFTVGFDPLTMICAGVPQGGADACQGDSGGPLMVADGAGGWVQVGVTSWGEGCARESKPGVYTRLTGLFGWVLANLAEDEVAPAGIPAATTGPATKVKRRKATVTATVSPNGLATTYVIEIGPNRRYATGRVEAYAGAGSTPVELATTFAGLKPGTTYHYRATAVNVGGVVQGSDRTFTTPAARRKKPRARVG